MTFGVIGIIGSGNIGSGVARMAVDAGLDVVMANSRGPATLHDLIASLGERAAADTAAGAAQRADLVVLAVPLAAYQDLPLDDVADKLAIDTMNYYPDRFGRIAAIDDAGRPSSEFLQQCWPNVQLVKALNNVDYVRLPRLVRPAGASDRTALPVASNDADTRKSVTDFLDLIGFDALDLGGLSDSWRFEPGSPLHVTPYLQYQESGSDDPYQRFLEADTVPVPRDRARQLADEPARSET